MIKYLFLYSLSIFTIFISFFQNEVVKGAINTRRQSNTSVKKNLRSASTTRSALSSKRSASSKGGTSSKHTSKTTTKKTTSSSKTSDTPENSEIKCLQAKISEILDGACSFLLDNDIKETLGEEDLYCVFNYKDVGKTSSIYNYYLRAYYGISESSVKANTSIVNVKNNAKNSLKYYEYLIDELNEGTLKESKILDSVTDAVLDNSDLDFSVQNTITNKSIESVPISINVIASDIANCTKLTKEALKECNAVGNLDVKNKISESCTAYNAALIKLAGAKKAEALGYDAEIINVLKQRVNADFYDYKDMVNLEKEKVELQKTYSNVLSEKKLLEYKSKRAELADKATSLISEIESLSSSELKTSKEETLANYKTQLCNLDKIISNLDEDYKPTDNLADCSANTSSDTSHTDKKSDDEKEDSEETDTSTKSDDANAK